MARHWNPLDREMDDPFDDPVDAWQSVPEDEDDDGWGQCWPTDDAPAEDPWDPEVFSVPHRIVRVDHRTSFRCWMSAGPLEALRAAGETVLTFRHWSVVQSFVSERRLSVIADDMLFPHFLDECGNEYYIV